MPTNDWWSSLAWLPLSERQYPHPLGVQAEPEGLRVFHAGARITANKDGVFGFSPGPGGGDLVIGHSHPLRFETAQVEAFSDWFVTARLEKDGHALHVSYGHGSPFVFARYESGTPRIIFDEPPQIWSGRADDAVLALSVADRHYALFAPTGSRWEGIGTNELLCRTEKDYFSLALLPDAKQETLRLFHRYAHAHVVDTRVSWSYVPESGEVTTSFAIETEPREGDERDTLTALYPHQWRRSKQPPLDLGYDSVRGRMKLIEGTSFQTVAKFPGVLPCLPNVGGADAERIRAYLTDEAKLPEPPPKDTYWDGKWLGRTATLVPIAEQYADVLAGDRKGAAKKAGGGRASDDKAGKVLLDRVRRRLEDWFTATDPSGAAQQSGVFYYDDLWGTVIGFPASYGSDNELNDHHFHYGYFIRAAAAVALRDRAWAADRQWGGMVKLLIRDIANADRGDAQFPFLRNFDPYAGHSWASGHAKFADGNNNESSSEAMNAWYGLILWGEATGDRAIRDLGVYLYTTEMGAINEYWFDVADENHPAGYAPSVVTMIWGGKGANATWFSARPEAIHGINWLPIHGGSLYLGHVPAYAAKNYAALLAENGGDRWHEWADLIWMYRALSNANDARRQFDASAVQTAFEAGNSPANAYHWIANLQQLGRVDQTVTADTTLYAVFRRDGKRTYCVYSIDGEPREVTFSDRHRLRVTRPGFTVSSGK